MAPDSTATRSRPRVAHLVQDAVQVALVADLPDQDGLPAACFQAHAFERSREALCQLAPDADPVSGRLHVPLRCSRADLHSAPGPGWAVITPAVSPGCPGYRGWG